MDWTQIINLLEAVCLLLLSYHIWTLRKGKVEAERKIEGLEEHLAEFGTALGREIAGLKDRVSDIEAANEDYKDFDDKLLNGLQGLLDYNMNTAAGGDR